MAYSIGSVQLSKWQLALLIGTPLALGLGIYVYKKSNEKGTPIDDGSSNQKATKKKFNAKGKKLSIDSIEQKAHKKKNTTGTGVGKQTPLSDATSLKNEGNVCYRNGKYDEAIVFYNKAIEKCPMENQGDLAIFYQNRAAAYEMLKKWNMVKEDCTRSLEFNRRYAKAYLRRAKAHEATGNMLDCLDDVTATCILEMFQNNATIMYADRILKQTGREAAERSLQSRVPVLPSNNFVRTYLRSFVTDPLQNVVLPLAYPNAPVQGFARAKQALDAQHYDEIIAACTEEIEASETEAQHKPEAMLLRGTFHLLSGSFTEAQQDFDAVINNVEADVSLRAYALIKRASLYIQLEQKDKGLTDFEMAEHLQPDNADIYHQRAQIYILLDQLPEALQEFEKAVRLAPEHAMAYVQKCYADYRLALVSQDQMKLTRVINDFKNAVEKFPDCVECYSLMAQVLSDQFQFQQADQFYEKAIKMAPGNASLYVHRGIMLLQWKGDVDKAIELMNQALEVDDKCELAYETLGTVEVQRANLHRAVDLFEQAIKLAKSQSEMCHLHALRNAAVAQINVTRRLNIDMSAISALTHVAPK